jgi:hypothetical protein
MSDGHDTDSTALVRRLYAWMRRDADNFLAAVAAPFLLGLIIWVHVPEVRSDVGIDKPVSSTFKPDPTDEQDPGEMAMAREIDSGEAGTAAWLEQRERVEDWSEGARHLEENPAFAQSQAICRSVISRRVPAADRPRPQLTSSLSECRPLDLYYNRPERRDPVRARLCALSEVGRGQPEESRLVLMNLYANGEGVPRNLDLSIHLACGMNVVPAEMHARVMRLDRLRTQRWTGSDFDYVLDDRSSFPSAAGVHYYIRIDTERRNAELRRLTAAWPAAQLDALFRLERAKAAYAQAHARVAIFQASPAEWIEYGPIENVEEAFLAQIHALSSGQVPDYSPIQIEATRQRMESNYRVSQRPREDTPDLASADFDRVEQAWRAYRDAFIRLAQIRSPELSRNRLATWLGRTRPDRLSLVTSEGIEGRSLPVDMDATERPWPERFASSP